MEKFHKLLHKKKPEITPTRGNDLTITMHSRKSLLFQKNHVKSGNGKFDNLLGCFDGAELHKKPGTYLLSEINKILKKENVGLFRKNSLADIRNLIGPEIKRKRWKIVNNLESVIY